MKEYGCPSHAYYNEAVHASSNLLGLFMPTMKFYPYLKPITFISCFPLS